jgi:hypothetical protein
MRLRAVCRTVEMPQQKSDDSTHPIMWTVPPTFKVAYDYGRCNTACDHERAVIHRLGNAAGFIRDLEYRLSPYATRDCNMTK